MQLRYATRTLIGPWGVLILIGLETANLLQLGSPWRGEFLWTTEWLAIALFIAGPLVAGLAAVDSSRIAREGALPIAATVRRSRGPFVFAAAAIALPASLVHLMVWIIALTVGRAVVSETVVSVMALLIQVLAIWWYAFLGSVVGRHLSPVAAGVTGTLVALGAFYSFSSGSGFLFLSVGGATVSRLGITLSWAYLLLQVAVLGVTLALLLAIPTRAFQRRWEIDTSVVIAVALFVLVIAGTRILGPAERELLSSPRPPSDCYFIEPTVCIHGEHRRVADSTVQEIDVLSQAAIAAGYESLVPAVVHEMTWSYRPSSSEVQGLQISSSVLAGGRWDQLFLANTLLTPAHCTQIFGVTAPGESYFTSLEALTLTWISLVENPVSDELEDVPPDLLEDVLTPQEAEEAKAFLDSCDF